MKRTAIIALVALVITMPLFAGCGISKEQYDKAVADLAQCQEDKSQLEEEKADLEKEIADLEKAATVAPSPQDVSYSALIVWLTRDWTNTCEFYPEGHYATTLFANAREVGIKSYLTRVTLVGPPQTYWYFTAFNTTDKGLVYIQPSQDKVITLEVGKKFHELNGLPSTPAGYGFSSIDDTILKIELFE